MHTEYGVCTNTMRSVAYERGRGREKDRGRRGGGGAVEYVEKRDKRGSS